MVNIYVLCFFTIAHNMCVHALRIYLPCERKPPTCPII